MIVASVMISCIIVIGIIGLTHCLIKNGFFIIGIFAVSHMLVLYLVILIPMC